MAVKVQRLKGLVGPLTQALYARPVPLETRAARSAEKQRRVYGAGAPPAPAPSARPSTEPAPGYEDEWPDLFPNALKLFPCPCRLTSTITYVT
ncbi:hypothetical protein EVAR_660_1 [Eumeta japonica]|uniref:Uncharacterized protein n=1 Tax=Eumeta variegata TaxID=151549 RepID=A0A4C1SED9_EUMVA|nr:hypothetical protein EVAR_660_1 [Eumeta japonica]